MQLTFDRSAAEFVLKGFDCKIGVGGMLWRTFSDGQESVNCVFCEKNMLLDDFAGVTTVDGEQGFFCKDHSCLIKASRYIEGD